VGGSRRIHRLSLGSGCPLQLDADAVDFAVVADECGHLSVPIRAKSQCDREAVPVTRLLEG
jgi:hypothetical protein